MACPLCAKRTSGRLAAALNILCVKGLLHFEQGNAVPNPNYGGSPNECVQTNALGFRNLDFTKSRYHVLSSLLDATLGLNARVARIAKSIARAYTAALHH